jgi:cytochrome c
VSKSWPLLCSLALGLVGGAASAQPLIADGERLARQKDCFACHAVERALTGPPFREMAKRLGAEAGILDRLMTSIREGSYESWGAEPMPPNPTVTPDEARLLANWILKMK